MPDPGQDKPFPSPTDAGSMTTDKPISQTMPNLSTSSGTSTSLTPPPLGSKPITEASKPIGVSAPMGTTASSNLPGPVTSKDKPKDEAKAQDEINKVVGGVTKPPLPPLPVSKPMGGQPVPESEKKKLEEKAKEMIKELDKEEDKLKQSGDKTTTEMPGGTKPKSGKMKTYIGGLIVILLLVGGVTAGLFLTEIGQDIRQKAEEVYPPAGGGCTVPGVCGSAGGCPEGQKCVRDLGSGDNYPYCRVDSSCGGTGAGCTVSGVCGPAGGCSEGYKCVRDLGSGDNYPYCSPDPTGCASADSGTGGVCLTSADCDPGEYGTGSGPTNPGECLAAPSCGDGRCNGTETAATCPADCGGTSTDSGTGECVDANDCLVPAPGVCQDSVNNPDSSKWKICTCPNGCTYKCDDSPGGGGCGWVCDQNCGEVDKGTMPSGACWQIDYVITGTGDYCGVAQINCPSSCRTGTTPPGDSDSADSDGGDGDSETLALVCNSMSASNAAPKIGDQVSFTCSASAQGLTIDRYEFRYSIDSGSYASFSASGGGATSSFTVNQAGSYLVQCRACTADNTCTPWEAL